MEYNINVGHSKQHRNLVITNYFSNSIPEFDLNDLKLLLLSDNLAKKYNGKHYLLIDNDDLQNYLFGLNLFSNSIVLNKSEIPETIKSDSNKVNAINNFYNATHYIVVDPNIDIKCPSIKFKLEFFPILIKHFTTNKLEKIALGKVYDNIGLDDPRLLSIQSILQTGITLEAVKKFIFDQSNKHKMCYSDLNELISINNEICKRTVLKKIHLMKFFSYILHDIDNDVMYGYDNDFSDDSTKYFTNSKNEKFILVNSTDRTIQKLSDTDLPCNATYHYIMDVTKIESVKIIHYTKIFDKPILRNRDRVYNLFKLDSIEKIEMMTENTISEYIDNIVYVESIDYTGYYSVGKINNEIILSRFN